MEKELLEACEDGDVEEVRRLLKNINGKDFDIETPLYIACENGHTDVVKLLLSDKRIGIKKANKNEEVKVDGKFYSFFSFGIFNFSFLLFRSHFGFVCIIIKPKCIFNTYMGER